MRRGRRVVRTRNREATLGPTGDLPVGFRAALIERAEELSEMSGGRTPSRVPEDLHRYTEKVVLNAYKVTDGDIAAVREAGVSHAAIVDAATVCSLLNIIDRISDAIGFRRMSADHLTRSARVLNRFGNGLNTLTAYPGRRSLRRDRQARQHCASVAATRRLE